MVDFGKINENAMSSIYQTFKIFMVNEFEGTHNYRNMIKTVRLYQLYP